MPDKATWLFNGGSEQFGKVWGFSETWYTADAGDALVAKMDTVSALRRLILSSDCSIVGYRIAQPGGRSFVIRKNFPGPGANDKSNLPVDACQTAVGVAGGPGRKKFFLHDLPDDWVVATNIPGVRNNAIRDVVQAYCDNGFQVRFQNQAALNAPVLSIDAAGNVVTVAPIALIANQTVSFLQSRDINNHAVRGSYIVAAVTDQTHFQLAHWTGQIVGRRGKVRLVSFLFGAAQYLGNKNTPIIGASRKVGRPFFQSRGRVPNRR
jgi:hypothetical protein